MTITLPGTQRARGFEARCPASAARTAAVAAVLALAHSSAALADDESAIERGRQVFEHYCAPCHGDGPGDDGAPMLPGTHAIELKYRGRVPALLEERADLPVEVLKPIVRNGIASMPPFRPTEVTDDDIAAIAAYLADSASRTER